MAKGYFDTRREHGPIIGLVRDVLQTFVQSEEYRRLLDSDDVKDLLLTDETPIPAIEDRENYYGERHLEYWLSGYSDWLKLRRTINLCPKLNFDSRLKYRYLDMGGATGRVARHAARNDDIECWLSDINVNWIDWLDKNFAYPLRSYQSRLFPSIPLEDNCLSLISAFSVFTHLDCDEMQWLLEMRRVLAPGGMLYITVLDKDVWELLKNPEWVWLRQSISRGNEDEAFASKVQQPMPGNRFVWEYSAAEAYNINVFLSEEYIKSKWAECFELVSYEKFGHGYQTAVTLRKHF